MKMTTKIISILLLTASLFGAACATASAAASAPSAQDEALLALINQARRNPLAAAASMGMDPVKIARDLPELEKILREGLPAVTFSETLFAVARAHTKEMFANGYYSHDSSGGLGYDARIRNSGYAAAATGESLGMLSFANFINPADAAKYLFEYMFWDELDPLRKEKRNILDPALKEAAVCVDTGAISLGGALWNVYLATVDFGTAVVIPDPVPTPDPTPTPTPTPTPDPTPTPTPDPTPDPTPVPTPEGELLKLINQARANPLGVAASLGINTTVYLSGRPELRAAFEQGLQPLMINAALTSSAQAHVADMMVNNYLSKISRDGRTYKERIAARGYRFAAAGESFGIAWLANPADDKLSVVGSVFQRMLQDEFDPSNAGELSILDPRMKEVGIVLGNGVFRIGNWNWNVYLAICDVGLSSMIAAGEP